MPTISRQAEIQAAAVQSSAIGQEQNVRYAQWTETAEPHRWNALRIPTWFLAVATVAVAFAIVLTLVPHPLAVLGYKGEILDLASGEVLGGLVLQAALFTLVLVWAVQTFRDNRFFRERVTPERRGPRRSLFKTLQGSAAGEAETEVGIVLMQQGMVYGNDRGLMRFEGSSLFFEGAQVSFSIDKSRLSLRPKSQSIGPMALKGELHPALAVLSYSHEGVEYKIGWANAARGIDAQRMMGHDLVRYWLNQPAEPVEHEVLLPRTAPASALRDAFESMKRSILVAEGLLFLGSMGLNIYLMDARFAAEDPKFGNPLHFMWVIVAAIGLEVGVFAVLFVVLPLIRAVKRYRFLKSLCQS